jgi:hypothetical protein
MPTEPLTTRRDGRCSARDLGWPARSPPGKGRYPLSDQFLATTGSARRMTIFFGPVRVRPVELPSLVGQC